MIKDYIEDYLNYIEVTKSRGTYHFYLQYLKGIDEFFGTYNFHEIDNNLIVKFIQKQKMKNPNLSNASINKYIGVLKSFSVYSNNHNIKFSKLREQKKIIPTISNQTIKIIFDYYKRNMSDKFSLRNYTFLKLLLDTGLRMNELINIQLKNIDFDTNSIYVQITKTGSERFVCFTESTSMLLKKYVAVVGVRNTLFYDLNTNNKMTTSSVESFIYRLKKKLNIKENVTPHKWRHTFATSFIKNGGDLETLRLLLGHSNLKTTQKYLHLSKNDIVSNYQAIMSH